MGQFTSAKTDEVNRAKFASIERTLNTVNIRLADMNRLNIDVNPD